MTLVYITCKLITEPGQPENVLGNWEFNGADWMEALDKAYDWLKINRRADCVYNVWC